jgi:hypothetical protein
MVGLMQMNWEGYERKSSLLKVRHCPGICLEELKKTTNSIRISGLPAEF